MHLIWQIILATISSINIDTCGEEVGELPAGVAGAVVTVSPGQQAGDGAQEVEHHHGEGIPVTETWEDAFRGMVYIGDIYV